MNDELKSLLTKVLLMGLTALATKLHVADGNTAFWGAIATDIADAIVAGYAIYSHRGMKRVPVEASATVGNLVVSPAGATTVTDMVKKG